MTLSESLLTMAIGPKCVLLGLVLPVTDYFDYCSVLLMSQVSLSYVLMM